MATKAKKIAIFKVFKIIFKANINPTTPITNHNQIKLFSSHPQP